MLKQIGRYKFQIIATLLVVIVFALLRSFESTLFYDPFITYFKWEFNDKPLPKYDQLFFYGNLILRYIVNSVLSILLIFQLFKRKDMLQISIVLYGLFLVLLVGSLIIVLEYFGENKMAIFYIRRFLIQPILLLLFIPGFYFQIKSEKSRDDNFLNR